jgi:DNA-binding FadR family transcriptional regulator
MAMARHAAAHISNEGSERLKSALEANSRAIGSRDKFMQTNIDFHQEIFRSASNPSFDAVHSTMVEWLMDRWRKIKRTRTTEMIAHEGHLQSLELVMANLVAATQQ